MTDGYVIMQGDVFQRGGMSFLVDRSQSRKQWWTKTLELAMIFRKASAANIQCRKLHHNHPQVVPLSAALDFEAENIETSDHPFSSEALGQE